MRRRILALQIAGLASLVIALLVGWAALWIGDHATRRVTAVVDRLEVLNQLDGETGHYAQYVVEVLAMGRNKADDLAASRIMVERLLAQLTLTTRAEISTLAGMAEIEQQLPELEGARRIIEVYHAIDASVNRMLADQRSGQPASAAEIYKVEISFRIANELRPLIESAASGERAELTAQLKDLGTAEVWVAGLAAAFCVVALVIVIVLAVGLRRAIVEPLAGLTGRARILAAGGMDEPCAVPQDSEFSSLAMSLDRLAEAMTEQRQRFATAGERLGAQVDERTAELRAANARLREIDHKRGQFLADISHELRTPLTILRGEADVGLRGRDDPALLRQALERIQGEAGELGKLLEDLINYARTEAEDQPYVIADTRLDEVIIAAAEEGETLAAPREVSVLVKLGDKGRHVSADFRRLKQALLIGLDNAIKNSPPGGEVEIHTAFEGDAIVIRIADQGPGVAETDLPHVFERFFRGRGNGEPASDGVGIGLAIAKDIVDRHAGSVALDNRAEGGAVLTIRLPRERAEVA
ncbi:MAG: HAMP domain-containing sensor histidine kinase [Devosia sp.]